jgi:glycosyltransferase involved in cell wall biosynthesis
VNAVTGKVAIFDMQPIDPPTGGGRLRLLGLYHGLGGDLSARYVGAYDWEGPKRRYKRLSATLEEQLIPLSAAHFAAAKSESLAAGGQGVIDVTFYRLAALSPDYLAAAREAAREADIVVFSHPWAYPPLREDLDPDRQMIVYDAHNMEGMLRLALLDDGGAGTDIVRDVVREEYALCHAAHLILACSHEDRSAFIDFYGIAPQRTRVAANGAFTRTLKPPTALEKTKARKALGLGSGPVALFLGSRYGPNVEAARFIASTLAPALPEVRFVIAGGVGEGISSPFHRGLRVTGPLSETEKRLWLHAADIAINPMFGGSGTNIKMLEFMAAGLAVVSTPIGARGLLSDGENLIVADPSIFAATIASLAADSARASCMAAAARQCAERHYSWETISWDLGEMLARHRRVLGRAQPFFSVIVPTYERAASLSVLVEGLAKQSWRDFELIIIDQSAEPWPERDRDFGLDLHYVHTDVRGAILARNRGADIAAGRVLAFIDDDCQPSPDWLAAAWAQFSKRDIAGLEGLITSDRRHHPDWRPVTNKGFKGIGFMTANLFVRADVFHRIDGFDIAFDNPHFREDTDLGWRIQAVGVIPFCRDAVVHHPAQPRSLERESMAVRSAFFEKDALLLRKHPEKYVELMRRECQWKHNPNFWTYFVQGLKRYGVEPPAAVKALMPAKYLAEADLHPEPQVS